MYNGVQREGKFYPFEKIIKDMYQNRPTGVGKILAGQPGCYSMLFRGTAEAKRLRFVFRK